MVHVSLIDSWWVFYRVDTVRAFLCCKETANSLICCGCGCGGIVIRLSLSIMVSLRPHNGGIYVAFEVLVPEA